MAATDALLLRVWRDVPRVRDLDLRGWTELLRQSRRAEILGRLAARIERAGWFDRLPGKVQGHLTSGLAVAAHADRVVRWEVRQLERVLGGLDTDLVLLKGAAYLIAGLELSRGRLCSDVDILVPKDRLPEVEARLLASGWEHIKLEPHDQLYYRQWTHELPPLRHKEREVVVDVHHGILPVTSRLKPDPARLLGRARSLPQPWDRWKVLSPEHLVLHAAAHGFHDGELQNPVRDILDVHELVTQFAAGDPSFGDRLREEARQLGVARPLHYALRYGARYLGEIDGLRPDPEREPPLAEAMDGCIDRALRSRVMPPGGASGQFALWALYLRSHWLRMPPRLLACHLVARARRGRAERRA
jgi:hypothetical protein